MLMISSFWLAPSVPVILDESPKFAHHLPLLISAREREGERERERERGREGGGGGEREREREREKWRAVLSNTRK